MPLITPLPIQALNADGDPVAGAKINVYSAGTTTAATFYSDAALSTPRVQGFAAGSDGVFDPIYVAAGTYKVDITDSLDASLPGYPQDNVDVDETASSILTTLDSVSYGAAVRVSKSLNDADAFTPTASAGITIRERAYDANTQIIGDPYVAEFAGSASVANQRVTALSALNVQPGEGVFAHAPLYTPGSPADVATLSLVWRDSSDTVLSRTSTTIAAADVISGRPFVASVGGIAPASAASVVPEVERTGSDTTSTWYAGPPRLQRPSRPQITTAQTWTVGSSGDYPTLSAALREAHRWRIAPTGSITISLAAGDHAVSGVLQVNHPDGQRLSIVGATSSALVSASLHSDTTTAGDATARTDGHAHMVAQFPSRIILAASSQIIIRGELNLDHLMIDCQATTFDALLLENADVVVANRIGSSKNAQTSGRCIRLEYSRLYVASQLATIGGENGVRLAKWSYLQAHTIEAHLAEGVGVLTVTSGLNVSSRFYCRANTDNGAHLTANSRCDADGVGYFHYNTGRGLRLDNSTLDMLGSINASNNGSDGVRVDGSNADIETLTVTNNTYGIIMQAFSYGRVGALTSTNNSAWGVACLRGNFVGTVVSIASNGSGAGQQYWSGTMELLGGSISGSLSPAHNTTGNGNAYMWRA